MKCYVVELKEINGGNCVANADGLASVRFKSGTHDVLVYAAPLAGDYVRARALMADDIIAALYRAIEELSDSGEQDQ